MFALKREKVIQITIWIFYFEWRHKKPCTWQYRLCPGCTKRVQQEIGSNGGSSVNSFIVAVAVLICLKDLAHKNVMSYVSWYHFYPMQCLHFRCKNLISSFACLKWMCKIVWAKKSYGHKKLVNSFKRFST